MISVAVAAAPVLWRIAGFDDGRDRTVIAPPAGANATTTDLTAILAWSPFGSPEDAAQEAGGGLLLKAIFMAIPAEASSAVIAVGDAPPVSVRPGQALSTGAVVQSIQIDHVILEISGQAARLGFPAPAALIDAPVAPANGLTIIAPANQTSRPASTPAAPLASPPSTGTIPSVVDAYRQRLAGNATGLAQDMDLTPTEQGYRVGDNLPPALRSLGLQPGDIVTRVNNQTVAGNANPQAILNEAVQSGGARVDIIRGGRTITLSFPLR
ncbi:hypothetical protein KOAAANKH_02047 [Brevundimonas sp. NIBR10]|nr:hypothetical protein KOAAANKH_02047 [Brevundimonas sp. NIBR10]